MQIPRQLQAGDDLEWTEPAGGYPAGEGWTMKIRLSGLMQIDLTSTASGNAHKFTAAKSETTNWSAGHYNVHAYVEKGDERHTVYTARVEVLQDFTTVVPDAAYDARSHVRRVFDALKAAIEGRSIKGYENITIAGRSITQMKISELIQAYHHYEKLVQQEEDEDRINRGEKGQRILTRFDTVSS